MSFCFEKLGNTQNITNQPICKYPTYPWGFLEWKEYFVGKWNCWRANTPPLLHCRLTNLLGDDRTLTFGGSLDGELEFTKRWDEVLEVLRSGGNKTATNAKKTHLALLKNETPLKLVLRGAFSDISKWVGCWKGKESWKLCCCCCYKSLQSCLTLCDPIDGGPPGSPVPGILQARTLEWAAIAFSKAWKWKVKVKSLSRVRLCATP